MGFLVRLLAGKPHPIGVLWDKNKLLNSQRKNGSLKIAATELLLPWAIGHSVCSSLNSYQ